MTSLKPGMLFKAIGRSLAMKTDPWGRYERTITHVDHALIEPETIVLLIELLDIGGAGVYIWLLGAKVVWQILSKKDFNKCWKMIR